jgi:hypothetical protein
MTDHPKRPRTPTISLLTDGSAALATVGDAPWPPFLTLGRPLVSPGV